MNKIGLTTIALSTVTLSQVKMQSIVKEDGEEYKKYLLIDGSKYITKDGKVLTCK